MVDRLVGDDPLNGEFVKEVSEVSTVNLTNRAMPTSSSEAPKAQFARRFFSSGIFIRVASVVVMLTAWQIIGSRFSYATSTPTGVWEGFRTVLVHYVLPEGWQSLQTFSVGFAICIVAGIPIGLAMARIKFIRIAIEPYVQTLNSMPMLAIFPLMIIAFGIQSGLRIMATVLFGIFGIIVNTYTGASRIDPAFEDVGRTFVASGWKRLTTIIFPGSLSYIFAGIRVGFGHAMIGAVVIEIEASMVGLGKLMNFYTQTLQLGAFFVVVVVLGTFSILVSTLLRRFQRWVLYPWDRSPRTHQRRARRVQRAVASLSTTPSLGQRAINVRRMMSRRFNVVVRFVALAYRALSAVARFLSGRFTSWIVRLAILGGIIAYWGYASLSVSRAVLPSPHGVATAFNNQVFVHHSIWAPLGSTLEVFIIGFLLSVIIGVPMGLTMGRYRIVALALDPYVSFLYGLPIIVFVPIFVIWFGYNTSFGIAVVVISAVWPVVINTMQGVINVDPNLIDVGESYCASERQILRSIVIPSTIPFVLAGARLAFSVSWIAVIVSEVVSSEQGLGGLISGFATSFLMADMFVPILFIAGISVVVLTIQTRLMPRLTPWAPRAQ